MKTMIYSRMENNRDIHDWGKIFEGCTTDDV